MWRTKTPTKAISADALETISPAVYTVENYKRCAIEEDPPPLAAERQAEIERILKCVPGTLDPEQVALRARAREAHELLWLRLSYQVCEVETFENPHVMMRGKGRPLRRGGDNE